MASQSFWRFRLSQGYTSLEMYAGVNKSVCSFITGTALEIDGGYLAQ
jgi:hypothetical protein